MTAMAWAVGATPARSREATSAAWSSTSASCPVKRSSSSSVRWRRARAATWATSSRVSRAGSAIRPAPPDRRARRTNADDPGLDQRGVVVQGGHVVAVLEHRPARPGRCTPSLDDVAGDRVDHVVLTAREHQHRAVDVGQLGLDLVGRPRTGTGPAASGVPGVGGLDAALLLDVRADAVDRLGAGVEQALDARPGTRRRAAWTRGLTSGDARQVRVALGQPAGQRAAHRQPDHHHVVAPGGQGLEVGLGGAGPVVPPGRDHVLERGAVPGQQGQLDRVAGGGQGLGQGPHGLGVAGEPVEDEDAVGATLGDYGSAPGMMGAVTAGDATGTHRRRRKRRRTRRRRSSAGRPVPVARTGGRGRPSPRAIRGPALVLSGAVTPGLEP